jgi:hypothetical protein
MPPELELGLMCERWGTLPEAGGVLDQPYGLLQKMSYALNIYRAIQSEHHRGDISLVEWSKRNPDAYRTVVRMDKKMRSNNGNE